MDGWWTRVLVSTFKDEQKKSQSDNHYQCGRQRTGLQVFHAIATVKP